MLRIKNPHLSFFFMLFKFCELREYHGFLLAILLLSHHRVGRFESLYDFCEYIREYKCDREG